MAAGLLADRILGEPPAAVHPVAVFGRVMERAEAVTYADRRASGVAHAALGLCLAGFPALLGRRKWGALAAATYVCVAGRALADAANSVGERLDRGDIEGARACLSALVGRDSDGLDAAEMTRAVVESVAENTVDAVVAPALWAAAAGLPGALAYRAINTLDAMVGHRDDRYERFGWASARLDDAANWVPARATAALVAGARPRSAAEVWRAVRDDAPAHPSPNAGVAEAAFAAALGVRLGGTNTYRGRVEHRGYLGMGRQANPGDIGRAVRLSRAVTDALAVLLLAAAFR